MNATHAIDLLKKLIAAPSFSLEENLTADILENFFREQEVTARRKGHNVWARNKHWSVVKPTLLLNSHHDTVRPAKGWTRGPFEPAEEDGKLYGLGSNDAGGCLVSLIATFLHFYDRDDLPLNLILAATAEEEVSGANGIAAVVPELGEIWAGIIGEPTRMQMAIAEKGLMVIDGEARGKAGHAARDEGVNAIYIALQDVKWLRQYDFERISPLLGPVKVSVTQINAGHQHNVVPDRCTFVVDVRTNELYSNEEVFNMLQKNTLSTLKARSFRLNSSRIDPEHPLVKSGLRLGRTTFGSPTLSDQALLRFPTLKMGPGDSARSHSADEFVFLREIEEGIALYVELIEGIEIEEILKG
jgi:acetylornithine deacetylase